MNSRHLPPLPAHWSPEQALAVFECLHWLRGQLWTMYGPAVQRAWCDQLAPRSPRFTSSATLVPALRGGGACATITSGAKVCDLISETAASVSPSCATRSFAVRSVSRIPASMS